MGDQTISPNVHFKIASYFDDNGELEVEADSWPAKLKIQFWPNSLRQNLDTYFSDSDIVLVLPEEKENLINIGRLYYLIFNLTAIISFADIIVFLHYDKDIEAFLGIIPKSSED